MLGYKSSKTMTWLAANCRTGLFLATALTLGGVSGTGMAGEAIVFGAERSKVEPGKDKTPAPNPFKLEKLPASAPFQFDGITPPILPQISTNPRKDKRQQNAEDEKKNWMFFEKGELQSKDDDENFLGRDDDFGEDLDKAKESHDYTFRESSSAKNPSRATQLRLSGHSQSQSPSQRRKSEALHPPPRQNSEDDLDARHESRSSAIIFGRDLSAGGRAGGDFDLKGLSEKNSERNIDPSGFSLRDFLGGGDAPRTRDQETRMKIFNNEILSRPDPINARQSINPVVPSWDSAPRSTLRTPASDGFVPHQTFAPANASPSFRSPLDASPRPFDSGAPAAAPGPWRATEVQFPKRL